MQRFLIFVSVIGLIAEANAQTLTIERRSDQIFQTHRRAFGRDEDNGNKLACCSARINSQTANSSRQLNFSRQNPSQDGSIVVEVNRFFKSMVCTQIF